MKNWKSVRSGDVIKFLSEFFLRSGTPDSDGVFLTNQQKTVFGMNPYVPVGVRLVPGGLDFVGESPVNQHHCQETRE